MYEFGTSKWLLNDLTEQSESRRALSVGDRQLLEGQEGNAHARLLE
jgi:hypothetical protein